MDSAIHSGVEVLFIQELYNINREGCALTLKRELSNVSDTPRGEV